MKSIKPKIKPTSSAEVVKAAGGLKRARLKESGKQSRVRGHLRATTLFKQRQRDRRNP